MNRLPKIATANVVFGFLLGVPLLAATALATSEGGCDLASAADTDSFLRYWQALGGEVEPEGEAQAILRLAEDGSRRVIEELASAYEESSSLVSMTTSAAASAADGGHVELAKELLSQLDFDALDERGRASYASVLIRLGETERANDILAALDPGSFVDATVVVHLIGQHGVEGGLKRLRELSSHPLLGVANTLGLYERNGDDEARQALLSSPQLVELMDDSMSASLVIPEVEKTLGEGRALALLEAALVELDALDPSSREFQLPSLVNLLARQGCSDACLRAAVEPIQAAAWSDPDWTEYWLAALAATGHLEAALARAEDPSSLLRPAKEWAQGRNQPRYLLPLVAAMTDDERANDVAWSVSLGLWSENDAAVLAETVALAGPITDPAPWAEVVGVLTRPSRITEDVRQAVREQLVRSTTPGCFVALEPLSEVRGIPLPSDELEAERERLMAELDQFKQDAEGGAEEPAILTPLADAREQRVQVRGVARCEGLVAVVSFDHAFNDASDPGIVGNLQVSHGCSEDERTIEWLPPDEVAIDSTGFFVLSSSGFIIMGQRREDGTFFGDLEDPGFEIACDDVTYSLCTSFEAEVQP